MILIKDCILPLAALYEGCIVMELLFSLINTLFMLRSNFIYKLLKDLIVTTYGIVYCCNVLLHSY